MKYWKLFQTHWQNMFVYSVSFTVWRFRQFISTFSALVLWKAIYQFQPSAFGYQSNSMITYIFLTGFLQSMIIATQTTDLGQRIYTGELSNDLVKPMNIFGALITRDIADKLMNFTFLIGETAILFWLFQPHIVFPNGLGLLSFFAAALLGAALIFIIMLLFGSLGFWSPETWGPRFLFYMFIDFTAGRFYPLSIFPKVVQDALFLTPFPYLTYVQTQIFLGKYHGEDIARTFVGLGVWIVVFWLILRKVWTHGMKEYGAAGR